MFNSLKRLTRWSGVSVFSNKMSSLNFVQRLNPTNNKMEWNVVNQDYDFYQEIATSCYGDMLHDDERNKKFGQALKKAIKKVHSLGKEANVLDIGTGTGLLSMMAVQYGADSVVACESFLPMANCAVEISKENNFSDKIKIMKCHSTSLTVGEKGDLKQKANILVSEVFDTELIGEGAIKTFNHAFENLLEENCIVIPFSGTVYAQVVESDLAQKWNKLADWTSGKELLVKIPDEIKSCPGAGAVHDIQLSEFDQKHFRVLSEVIPVFKFYWARDKKIQTHGQQKSVTKAISSGRAQVVFMWWDLNMDEEGEILLSCAPVWEHPNVKGKNLDENIKSLTKSLPWRDHWMQAVYFFRKDAVLREGEDFVLWSNHDEFSFWFEIEGPSGRSEVQRPVCDCAFHFLLSRTRMGALNDDRRRKSFFEALKAVIDSNTICLAMTDTPLLNILCAKLGAKKVFVLSEVSASEKVCSMLLEENNVKDVVSLQPKLGRIVELIGQEPGSEPLNVVIVSEPFFRNSILPWDNLAIWYMREDLTDAVEGLERVKSIRTFPGKCRLNFCAVQFDNLWKIAAPLNTCEGFSMKIFDELIANAKANAENYVQAQPLWEYPGIALTKAFTLFEFDLNEKMPNCPVKRKGQLKFECPGRCDGIALWMEYCLKGNFWLSFGTVEEPEPGRYISWDMFERQGVHLFRSQTQVNPGDPIFYEAQFNPREAQFNFDFDLKSNRQEVEN